MCQGNMCQGGLSVCAPRACTQPIQFASRVPAANKVEIWAKAKGADQFEQIQVTAATNKTQGLEAAKKLAATGLYDLVCLELKAIKDNQLKLGIVVKA